MIKTVNTKFFRRMWQSRKVKRTTFLAIAVALGVLYAGQTKWIAVASIQNWYSDAGSEIEVGRRGRISDQQDGLRWPAQYNWQDLQAAKAMWIGSTNYSDAVAAKTMPYKVVHVGPRVVDEINTIMTQEFKLIARREHPNVYVDNSPGSALMFGMDEVDEVDPTLPVDRMLYNVINTSMGVTATRKIYSSTNQYHDNYFVYEYIFENTGIINNGGTVNAQTLTGLTFFFQYRYAPSREAGVYGGSWTPQSVSWGHSVVNDEWRTHPVTGTPFRALFSWLGLHHLQPFDIVGAPAWSSAAGGDGHLTAPHYVGVVTLYADKSAADKTDDITQPTTTQYLGSDIPIQSANNQYNEGQMAVEYAAMTAGHPAKTHAQVLGCLNPYDCPPGTFASQDNGGGWSHGQGFGPYTLAPGESIRIVLAEGAASINRAKAYEVGATWLAQTGPYPLPDKVGGGEAGTMDGRAARDVYKNAWVYTGEDSLIQTFERAKAAFATDLVIPQPPIPPDLFEVKSGGDKIALSWDYADGVPANVAGFRVFRAIHRPDTTFQEIFATGLGTENPDVVTEYLDTTPIRGFNYYYYVIAFDDGSTNDIAAGVPLESSKFWTLTIEPAFLRRPSVNPLSEDEIRIVPNPFNIRAQALQFGSSDPDRIMFYNLPEKCTIRIYTERGDLIKTLEHTDGSGDEEWTSVTSSRQIVASGVYIAHIQTPKDGSVIKKFVVIR